MQLAPDSELILQLTNPDLPVVTLIRNLDTSRDFPDEMLAVLLTLPPAEIRHGLRIYRADSVPDLPDPQLQAAALAGFKAFREILLPEGLLPGFYFLCSPGSTRPCQRHPSGAHQDGLPWRYELEQEQLPVWQAMETRIRHEIGQLRTDCR